MTDFTKQKWYYVVNNININVERNKDCKVINITGVNHDVYGLFECYSQKKIEYIGCYNNDEYLVPKELKK